MASTIYFEPVAALENIHDGMGNISSGEMPGIVEVNDKYAHKAFLQVPRNIYKHDPMWVEPLHHEIAAIFDPALNSFYSHGTTKRWILISANYELIGRIAAFVNYDKIEKGGKRYGGIGFFECIDDVNAAKALFEVAESWLKEHDINAVEGPINFGENEKFWGLLTDGFEIPSYGMNYNPPYYKRLFETNGFQSAYEQYTNQIDLKKPLPVRFERIAQRVLNKPEYHFEHFDTKDKERHIDDFMTIYNKAWASFDHFKPIDKAYVEQTFKELKPILEEEFVWFAYVNNEPAGFLIGTPDVNPILKHMNGKLNWFNKLKFAYLKQTKGFSKARVIIMGIVPEYQRHGLESGLILNAYRAGQRKSKYKQVELAWVGDFNEKMIAIHKAMGATFAKKHVTFEKTI